MGELMEKDPKELFKLDIEESCKLQQIVNELSVIIMEDEDGYIPEPPC